MSEGKIILRRNLCEYCHRWIYESEEKEIIGCSAYHARCADKWRRKKEQIREEAKEEWRRIINDRKKLK